MNLKQAVRKLEQARLILGHAIEDGKEDRTPDFWENFGKVQEILNEVENDIEDEDPDDF